MDSAVKAAPNFHTQKNCCTVSRKWQLTLVEKYSTIHSIITKGRINEGNDETVSLIRRIQVEIVLKQIFTCSKSAIKALEEGVEYVQS